MRQFTKFDMRHDTKRYSTQSDCRSAISPEGTISLALPGAGRPRDGNSFLPNYGAAGMVAYTISRIAGHARRGPLQVIARRTVAAVGARPGPSSFAPIFRASPQYRTFGSRSLDPG